MLRAKLISTFILSASRIVPRIFIVSAAIGFGVCMLAGRSASKSEMLKDEIRLGNHLNPIFGFYPTASSLRAKALAGLKRNQTLVLIGGNSNFNGQGQNISEVWTLDLQNLLGEAYKVVNLATMGSESADLAGVVFRMIEPLHPSTLLILNTYSTRPASFDGSDGSQPPTAFTYFFWDAYYKGLIPYSDDLKTSAERIRKAELESGLSGFDEIHIGAVLDSITYARDLWTFLDYEYFSTVWMARRANHRFASGGNNPFVARKKLKELEEKIPSLEGRLAATEMSEAILMQTVRAHFKSIAEYDSSGRIVPVEGIWDYFVRTHDLVFTPEQRRKVLICVLSPSPEFIRRLDPREQGLLNYVRPRAVAELRSLGYFATSIGENFDGEDYETSFHFVASGGRKIATIVADQVTKMVEP